MWMSIWDIHKVRNRIIGMFMAGNETLVVAPHEKTFGASKVLIYGGSNPCFEYKLAPVGLKDHQMRLWLCVTGRWTMPFWIVEMDGQVLRNKDDQPIKYRFNDAMARIPAMLVKAYSKHWPFLGTQNYIVRNEVVEAGGKA